MAGIGIVEPQRQQAPGGVKEITSMAERSVKYRYSGQKRKYVADGKRRFFLSKKGVTKNGK